MEWAQVFVMVITVAGLFLWSRSESKSDYRHMDAKIEANLQAIRDEMKDFHGKLLILEERYLQMREK
jgi:hypothetical protein